MNNNMMRWIPIDCTIPGIAGLLAGFACAVFADILPMFHVNWLMSHAMWAAPIVGVIWTIQLYLHGVKEISQIVGDDVTSKKNGVDKHV